jgi:hypothetical protein
LCKLENETNEHNTPVDRILQCPETNDEPRIHDWSYRQVIGILNYIAATSHPDITFAAHQCARFSGNTTRKHEVAVCHIVRYLKGTCDKGFILHPSTDPTLDCYADADFYWSMDT